MQVDIQLDSPTLRVSIDKMELDQLEVMLDAMRERRLARVKKLEEIAKVKADEADLAIHMKFNKALAAAKKKLAAMVEADDKLTVDVNKLRAMVVEMEA